MAIEKMERFGYPFVCQLAVDRNEFGPQEHGSYVRYQDTRAREDALLKALKAVLDLHCSMDMGETSTQARLLIREIEGSR